MRTDPSIQNVQRPTGWPRNHVRDGHQVWDQFRQGSEHAFTSIYRRYVQHLYRYGKQFTASKYLIEDSIHDLFVELWHRRAAYGNVLDLKWYLLSSFKHRLFKNLQKAKRWEPEINDECETGVVFSHEVEIISNQIIEERRQYILRSISTLTRREKEAITLRFYNGLSYEEIAATMSVSVKSAYKLMYRAFEGMKKHIPHR